MIIVRIIGGLGNQLFQYAAARRIAYFHSVELALDISEFQHLEDRNYCLHHFNIIERIATHEEVEAGLGKYPKVIRSIAFLWLSNSKRRLIKEKHFHFDPAILQAPDNVYLDGYWQSEKYFKDIEGIIRKEYTVKSLPDKINQAMAEKISLTNSVSIHIRRGDYVTKDKTNQFHGTCTLEYYDTAVNELARVIKDPTFFVFSDDIEWAREYLKLPYPVIFVGHNSPEKGFEDLRLMSLCNHHIIANSTFSWWGAWLSTNKNKIVYTPKRWFAAAGCNTDDLIPETWHRC